MAQRSLPAKKRRPNHGSWAWDDSPLRPMPHVDRTEWWEMAAQDTVAKALRVEGFDGVTSSAYQQALDRAVETNESNSVAVHAVSSRYHEHRVRLALETRRRALATPTFHGPSPSTGHLMRAFLDTIVTSEVTGRNLSVKW
jgi:hypothetical protein